MDKTQKQQKEKQVATVNNPETHSFMEENGDEVRVNDELLKLVPAGYSFCPADEVLIVHYLKKKILNKPLPINNIRSINLYKCSPQQLTEMYQPTGENLWHFYTLRYDEHSNGNGPNRAAGDGYWKATGARTVIYDKGKKVGFKKPFSFYEVSAKHGEVKTKWRMREYRYSQKRVPSTKNKAPGQRKFDDWVLCKIYKMVDEEENNLPQDKEGEPNAALKAQSDEETLLTIVVELLSFLDLLDSVLGEVAQAQQDSEMESAAVQAKKGRRKSGKKKLDEKFSHV